MAVYSSLYAKQLFIYYSYDCVCHFRYVHIIRLNRYERTSKQNKNYKFMPFSIVSYSLSHLFWWHFKRKFVCSTLLNFFYMRAYTLIQNCRLVTKVKFYPSPADSLSLSNILANAKLKPKFLSNMLLPETVAMAVWSVVFTNPTESMAMSASHIDKLNVFNTTLRSLRHTSRCTESVQSI